MPFFLGHPINPCILFNSVVNLGIFQFIHSFSTNNSTFLCVLFGSKAIYSCKVHIMWITAWSGKFSQCWFWFIITLTLYFPPWPLLSTAWQFHFFKPDLKKCCKSFPEDCALSDLLINTSMALLLIHISRFFVFALVSQLEHKPSPNKFKTSAW